MCEISEPINPNKEKTWVRRKFLYNEQLLVVSDWIGGISENNKGEITGSVATQQILTNATPFEGEISNEIHVIAHTQDLDRKNTSAALFTANATNKKVVVLHVNSNGLVGRNSEIICSNGATFVWLSQKNKPAYVSVANWIKQFQSLDFEDAKKLVACKDRSEVHPDQEEKHGAFLDIILPGNLEYVAALRLLCEAYLADDALMQAAKAAGLELNRPTLKADWFGPFKTNGGAEQTAKQIASQMITTEAKENAEKLLYAISQLDDSFVDNKNLEQLIKTFLNPTESTKA